MKKMLFRWLLALVTIFSCLMLTAAANEVEYTIILDVRGGNPLPAITTAHGAKVTAPGDPTRYGYDFGGWYADEALTTPYTFTTMPEGGATVYAKWISKDQGRGIEYRINDITFRDPDSYELLDSIPDDDFLAEISVTNIASTKMDTVLFVSYTDQGQMLGFHYAFANPAVGQSMTFGTVIDNEDGQVGQIKAMVWSSLAGAVPLAEAVDTNEGIDLGALVNDIIFVSQSAIENAEPVGINKIRLDVTVLRTGEVKNIRTQAEGMVEAGFYVCRYVPGERQHVLTIADNEVLKDELDLKSVQGFITGNQAIGEDYTMVGGLALNIETGLDMLGHFVTAYYSEAYKNEREPGVAYCLMEEAEYITVTEPIDADRKAYLAAFGSKVRTEGAVHVMSFDGANWGDVGFIYDEDNYMAAAGTYVINSETGKICAYIAPVSYSVGQVSRVVTTAGKESIKIGTILYDNTEEYDEIIEYDGIAEDDVVIVKNYNGIVYVTKAEIISGKVTKTGVVDNKAVTYIDGKAYMNAGKNVSAISGMVATMPPSNEITYDAYIYDGKLLGLIENFNAADLSEAIYVVGSYAVTTTGTYGTTITSYLAQGVDTKGEEVSVLIGVDDMGANSIAEGFYTFKESAMKDEAKKGIMIAVAAKGLDMFDEEIDTFFAEMVTGTINGGELKKNDKYVWIGRYGWDARVHLTDSTKFILIDATTVGDELEVAAYTGPINKFIGYDNVVVAATMDEDGNYLAEMIVITTDSISLRAEGYIYVVDGADFTVVEDGYEYTVYMTETNEFKTIVSDVIVEAGFYGDYTVDEDGIYDLGWFEEYADVVENQLLIGVLNGNYISSDDIDLYDASNSVIVDVRSEEVIEASETGEIETLKDMVSAYKGNYQILFNAILDIDGSDDLVTHIFVTDIVTPIDGPTPEVPGPDAADVNDTIYVVGSYAKEIAGTYASTTHYYAQGIDAEGKEVSVLIGVDDLGMREIWSGFYIFKESTVKEEAKKNIMVATAAESAESFDDKTDKFFAGAVTDTINAGELKKTDKYVIVGGDWGTRVYLTDSTKFILVDAFTIGDELEVATYTGPIAKDVYHDVITALVTVDEYGNYQAEIVVIVTVDVALKAEDYIYVVDGNDYSAVADGFEYNVYFTSTNEFKTIVSDWHVNSGFYGDYTIDEDGIYDLGAATEQDDAYVLEGQTFAGIFGESAISSDDIDLYDASNAVIVDVRGEDVLEDSEVAEIETLKDIVSANKAKYKVEFNAIVDFDGDEPVVTHIFVTGILVPVYDEYDEIVDFVPEFYY